MSRWMSSNTCCTNYSDLVMTVHDVVAVNCVHDVLAVIN